MKKLSGFLTGCCGDADSGVGGGARTKSGSGDVVAVLYHRDRAKHPNVPIQSGGSQDQRTQFFSDFVGLEAMKHQVMHNLDWQLQTMRYPVVNNPPSAPELLLSGNLHVPATQLLRHVTQPPLAVQLQVLLQDQEEPSFHQDRDHDRHRPHLCSFGSISLTVQPLDFSVHVISHTGTYARSSERRHEQRLFGQLSETAVVVQNLIDCLWRPCKTKPVHWDSFGVAVRFPSSDGSPSLRTKAT